MNQLSIVRGDTRTLKHTVTLSGAVVDLTGCKLWFTARKAYGTSDADAVFQASTDLGTIAVPTPANGIAFATITPAMVASLPNTSCTRLMYSWKLRDASGGDTTLETGTLDVYPSSTIAG